MDFTFELSKMFGVLPFEILKQDKDEVILLVNYMVEKGDNIETPPEAINPTTNKDRFWDF